MRIVCAKYKIMEDMECLNPGCSFLRHGESDQCIVHIQKAQKRLRPRPNSLVQENKTLRQECVRLQQIIYELERKYNVKHCRSS